MNQLVAETEGDLRLHARNVAELIEQSLAIAGVPPDDSDYANEDESTPAESMGDEGDGANTPASSPYDSD